jgi:hypothetical protein
MNFVFLNHLNHCGERRMGAHGAIRWPAKSPDLNPLDFFIFIRNFRDNVYLTPPGTQKELKKNSASMSGKAPKFFTECKERWAFLEGIDSVCNSIAEILNN